MCEQLNTKVSVKPAFFPGYEPDVIKISEKTEKIEFSFDTKRAAIIIMLIRIIMVMI